MRARIHRDELERTIKTTIVVQAASMLYDESRPDGSKALYANAKSLASNIVWNMLRDFTVIRKSKTQRTL